MCFIKQITTMQKQEITMNREEFVNFMLGHTHRHMAGLTADTLIEKEQLRGGKKTAAKYGGYVKKNAKLTWNHGVDYQKAVENKLKKFDLNPEAFLSEEHRYARRALLNNKLTSMAYHKADADLPLADRRWYLVTYIMDGVVKSRYGYTDANGNVVEPDTLHAELYDKISTKQANAGLTTIDMQVIYRNYSINSLTKISFEGYDITLS